MDKRRLALPFSAGGLNVGCLGTWIVANQVGYISSYSMVPRKLCHEEPEGAYYMPLVWENTTVSI